MNTTCVSGSFGTHSGKHHEQELPRAYLHTHFDYNRNNFAPQNSSCFPLELLALPSRPTSSRVGAERSAAERGSSACSVPRIHSTHQFSAWSSGRTSRHFRSMNILWASAAYFPTQYSSLTFVHSLERYSSEGHVHDTNNGWRRIAHEEITSAISLLEFPVDDGDGDRKTYAKSIPACTSVWGARIRSRFV